jgi:hypothetical protein
MKIGIQANQQLLRSEAQDYLKESSFKSYQLQLIDPGFPNILHNEQESRTICH